jgi:hypothetical protein
MPRILLMLALAAVVASSAVDPHAAERDPDHTHIVVGGTALDRARALEWHLKHGHDEHPLALPFAASSDEDEQGGNGSARAHVLSIRSGQAADVMVLSLEGGVALSSNWLFVPPSPPEVHAPASVSVFVSEADPSVLEPPPRNS